MNSEQRQCQSCKQKFTIEPDDFAFYETIKVPPPTWCPRCRRLRRFAWTGYHILYKRPCDTGEQLISIYHPDAPYTTYTQEKWWSDEWDSKSYGRVYDFSRPFFEQYDELLKSVPSPTLHTEHSTLVNSEYCNAVSDLKNCYLLFMADRAENCAYFHSCSIAKDSLDLTFSNSNELCYDGLNLTKCYRALFSENCSECRDVYFSKDLVGCSDCFGCIGLRKKQFHIFNQPYSKEEYQQKIKEFDFGSYARMREYKEKAATHFLKFPRKNFHTLKAYNSSGDYLYNCKNVRDSFWVDTAEDVRYSELLQAQNSAKCYDYSGFSLNAQWVYECTWVGINTSNVKFCYWNYSAHDVEYCYGCHSSGNLFGCVGVRNSEYCILNKQYSKEEYLDLVEKIKKQMSEIPYTDTLGRKYRYGDYFPNEICPWRYNETRAQEYFPVAKEEALAKGFSWRDPDLREYQQATMVIPDHINDVKDDILQAILKCEECGKNYRLIRMELEFYRHMNIPIPRKCYLCRDLGRIRELNPMDIYSRICAKCGKDMQTSYAPARPEIVYCEACYQNEVA
ncbi:MAG: hypothetical protein HYW65_03940 [Candidatus Liptonbacteria bacterium]|nr:hypothetical protein [Candidatus Liptonbacteria bacterium]